MKSIGPTGLPIEEVVGQVCSALADHGHAVLAAEPGAGKTTLVPLRLVDQPWLEGRRIVMLEPRRLAARASARRMAELIGEPVGETVGYRTRDETKVGSRTRIEVVTDGVLVRQLQHDPSLPGVGLVIFDEFHERSLVADLALAFALDARSALVPDLRLLVMSATIDTASVAALLGGDVPVVTSTGRTYPIDLKWVPRTPRDRLEPAVVAAVEIGLGIDTVTGSVEDGDVLVFLPGAASIRRVERGLRPSLAGRPIDVRLLFGALSSKEQDAALAPSPVGRRKVVLSTDIAETSLTVEGVSVVVDSGEVRRPRFDPRTGMTRLVTTAHSRASADQRAGRAGRTRPGTAIRLWSKIEHGTRQPFDPAEITQVELSGLALELAAWGVADSAELALLDPPPPGSLAEARELLEMLGALDDGQLSKRGRAMSALPLHPRLARMVVDASAFGHGWMASLLAALLDERDVVRGRPEDVPVDLAVRLALLVGAGDEGDVGDGPVLDLDQRALQRVRHRARQIARRARIDKGQQGAAIRIDQAGTVLALAYPDRVAQLRGSKQRRSKPGKAKPSGRETLPASGSGRYRMRNGSGAWLAATDSLAREPFLVVADLDGDRRDARIRRAAALDAEDLAELSNRSDGSSYRVETFTALEWDDDRNDLVARSEDRLDGLVLRSVATTPTPGPDTIAAPIDQIARTGLGMLAWTERDRELRARLTFLHATLGAPWPDVSDDALLAGLDTWLAASLAGATKRRDVQTVSVSTALRALLVWPQDRDLDRLAPAEFELPGGRRRRLRYDEDRVVLSTRAQDLYGLTEHPSVANGAVPVMVELLSPAQRPIQITGDLPGFWAGSWAEVRKEMSGRYPKHDWPLHPGS